MSNIPEIFERAFMMIKLRMEIPTREVEEIVREDPSGVVAFGEEIINTMEHRAYIYLERDRHLLDERGEGIVLTIVDIARRLCQAQTIMPPGTIYIDDDVDEASRLRIQQILAEDKARERIQQMQAEDKARKRIQQMQAEDKAGEVPRGRIKIVSRSLSLAAARQLARNAERGKVQVLAGDESTEDEDDGFILNVDDLDPEDMQPPPDMAGLDQHMDDMNRFLGVKKTNAEDLLVNSRRATQNLELHFVEEGTPSPPLSVVNEEELSEEEQIRLAIERSLMDQ